MPASLNDKISDTRNAARPNSAKVVSPRSAGGATLICDNLVGWPTASKVHFVTYKIDSSSNVVAGTQLDCYGIVSGNSITSFTVVDGNDVGHAVNDVVEMLPTAAWGQDLADALTLQHSRTGTHKSVTTDTLTTTGNATIGGSLGGPGYDVKTIANSYKFSVYRNAALSTGNGAFALISYDTKFFDTSSNIDVVTNKGRFTAPVAGYYFFIAQYSATVTLDNQTVMISLYKNGSELDRGGRLVAAGNGNILGCQYSNLIQLAANDYVEIFAYGSAAFTMEVGAATAHPTFSGCLMWAL